MEERQLTHEIQCPPFIPMAFADPEKIRQVLINLITNAIKFTPEKGHIQISVEPLAGKRQLRICVSDTGVGIAPEDQAKIFSKFEQVRSARQSVKGPKGTGLGLAISRSLIELHGGTLGVQSRLGEGSTFYFSLPATEIVVSAQESLPV
jgi:signal transduction histidine kinase